MNQYSLTKIRTFQWILIILVLAAIAGGYFYYRSKAAVTIKVAPANAPAYVNTSCGNNGQWGATSIDFSHSTSGNNRLLVVGFAGSVGSSVTSGTYGGQSLVKLTGSSYGNATAELWYLINPPIGSNTVSLALSSGGASSAGATTYTNVDQSSPFRTTNTEGSSDTSYNVTVSGESTDLVIDVISTRSSTSTPHGSQTERVYCPPATFEGGSLAQGSTKAGGSSVTMTWTNDGRETVLTAVPVKGAPLSVKINASPNASLTSGLVGHWTFDGADTTTTTATDRGTGGNNGTLTNGPAVIEGKLGQGLSFDGSNDYVSSSNPSSLNITGAITVSLWVKRNAAVGAYDTVVSKAKASNTEKQYMIDITSNNFRFGDEFGVIRGATTISNGQWHHVVGVYTGNGAFSGLSLYVNGIAESLTEVGTFNGIESGSGSDFFIGQKGNPLEFFNGTLDEVRIYNRALSAAEIQSLYQLGEADKINSSQGDSLTQGLTGYWKLDDGSGTSAADASGNGLTGTLTNGPTWTAGQIESAVNFALSNKYIAVTNATPLNPTSQITLSTWVKRGDNTRRDFLISKGLASNAANLQYWLEFQSDNTLRFNLNDTADTNHLLTSTKTIIDTTWHHVVGTYDGATQRLYIDGTADASTASWAVALKTLSDDLALGNRSGTADIPLLGSLDEVRIYNRALSAEEISRLYRTTAPQGVETSLVGFWSFNGKDLSGTTAYDRSGKGNNGTLTNGPAVIEGKLGQALSFDGSNDYVSAGNIGSVQNISYWIKPSVSGYSISLSDSRRYLLNNGLYSGTNTATRYINGTTPTAESLGSELLTNGTLESGSISPWWANLQGGASGSVSITTSNPYAGTYALNFNITNGGTATWHAAAVATSAGVSLTSGTLYKVTFAARSSVAKNGVTSEFYLNESPFTNAGITYTYDVTTSWVVHTFYFYSVLTSSNITSSFSAGNLGAFDLYLDNISIKPVSSVGDVTNNAWNFVSVNLDSSVSADNLYLATVGGRYFQGLIDDVRIYNTALSATEITNLYNQGR